MRESSLPSGCLKASPELQVEESSVRQLPKEELVHRRIRGPCCSIDNDAGDSVNLADDFVIKP